VTNFTVAAENYALAQTFDATFVLKHSFEKPPKRQIRLQMMTGSKNHFDAISHSTQTKEKRISIDNAHSQKSFESRGISELGLVSEVDMIADCFMLQTMRFVS
jgi:hypothetical protein